MTEQKAIEGCRRQDRISQKYLFDAYSDMMLTICVRYVKSLPDAEELMLNGFFSFYRSIDRFVYNGTGSLVAWLKKIMINECLMFLRKKGALKISDERHAEDVAIDGDLAANISAGEIFKLTTTLPDGYRTVFNLFAIEGYGHKEIAAMLNIAEGTSKSQLNKARAILQQLVKQNGHYYEQ